MNSLNRDREIKFRAWDKEKKKMIVEPPLRNSYGKWIVEYEDVIKENIELMQFTGLLDKNGKEIYEGDVLSPTREHKFKQPPIGLKCVVVWDEHYLTFSNLKDNVGDGEYLLCESTKKHWEVIGNIYENPELLNTNTK